MSESGWEIPPGLKAHFRRHNRHATMLALSCLVGSIFSWAAVYGLLIWAELLFLTTTRGVDAPTMISIGPHFLVVASVLFAVGSLVRRWKTHHQKFNLAVAFLQLMSIPARLTYAVWDNLTARVYPTKRELAAGWEILETLRTEKKIPSTNIAALLESDEDPSRITFLLAITGLIDTDNYGGIYYHHLRNGEAERLVRRWSRALLPEI